MSCDLSHLGELEMKVLEHVWEHGESDVKAAHGAIGVDRGITLNTVQSTFKRLWEKGLLSRRKESHAYIYAAKIDRRGLTEVMVGELVEQVAGSQMRVALEAFVSLAERAGEESLARLEELVAARRKAGSDDGEGQ